MTFWRLNSAAIGARAAREPHRMSHLNYNHLIYFKLSFVYLKQPHMLVSWWWWR